MPEENVKVAATFKEIPESVIEDAEIDLQTTASDYEIATRAAGTKSIYLNVPGNKIWYGRYNTRYYTTNEGQVAYCMNPLLKTPGAGWYTGSLISDGSSRKAFYYAYGGPGYSQFVNRYGWIWNGVRDLEYAYSHVILSYTNLVQQSSGRQENCNDQFQLSTNITVHKERTLSSLFCFSQQQSF